MSLVRRSDEPRPQFPTRPAGPHCRNRPRSPPALQTPQIRLAPRLRADSLFHFGEFREHLIYFGPELSMVSPDILLDSDHYDKNDRPINGRRR